MEIIRQERGGAAWLKSTLKQAAQGSDFEEATSAIAEICCYGVMREAGFIVRPIPTKKNTPTPDFEFELDGTIGVVEVTAKLEHDAQRARQIAAGDTPEGVERSTFGDNGGRVDFTTMISHPFGAPDPDKPGDTTQTSAISRICSIKAKETQFADGKPSLLWIDFRDLGKSPGVFKEEQSFPLISGNHGTLCSGVIWYTFYGSKGAPYSTITSKAGRQSRRWRMTVVSTLKRGRRAAIPRRSFASKRRRSFSRTQSQRRH